ncbi:AraC family transcriptional regulator [Kosakonia sp. ML.JS2a]|uniref:AraC family transcriptional regulator n=1 Tax=Kosakonia sp. ML.JS2a TaxID=2980557 RepID=UPI0021D84D8D|nr:AraC family transcriptional regulator [Kosakonia sp. ML.JS2a]UXY08936.1 AraC family transcriptional regulator [Kosakonia sp. ML.JS2a]
MNILLRFGHFCSLIRQVSPMNAPDAPPLYASIRAHPAGDDVLFHHHDEFQLTVAVTGTARIQTETGWWLAMPGTAVLIAPGVLHRAIYPRQTELVNLRFMSDDETGIFPPAEMFNVSGLMMALVQEARKITDLRYCEEESDLIRRLLLWQLKKNTLKTDMFIPEGRDKRLRSITTHLRNDPGCTQTLAQLSAQAHASQRTLSRLFAEETGMSFIRWRERLRTMVAIEKMSAGQTILGVALDLGYQSASSFTTAFTRLTGMPPRQYMKLLVLD